MATRQQCREALEAHAEELQRLPHVVGLGIVPLEEGKKGGKHAVGVYVDRIVKARKAGARIPDVVRLEGKQGKVDIPVRVIEIGEVSLE